MRDCMLQTRLTEARPLCVCVCARARVWQKPVSSLLAKFENMNKGNDPFEIQTQPQAQVPSARTLSPSPNPDRSRDEPAPATSHPALHPALHPAPREPPAVPKTRPKEKPVTLQLSGPGPGCTTNSLTSLKRPHLPPPISPRPMHPPSVLVEPPVSPPKRGGTDVAVGERPGFLHQPDSLVKSASPSGPKQFKIPSRPHTPVLDPRRSPRLAPSQPPSPPPPRRSAELRREKDTRETTGKTGPPPPVKRSEKPHIRARTGHRPEVNLALDLPNKMGDYLVSPFSSPPSSDGGSPVQEEALPMLPSRPRPQPEPQDNRSQAAKVAFEPPPVHHTVVSRRKEREEANGPGRPGLTPQATGDRPALPARPVSAAVPSWSHSHAMLPPPRPPRPGTTVAAGPKHEPPHVQQKRVVSTPTTQQQQPPLLQLSPPPTRTHGRSMTVDRTSPRVPSEFRVPVQHIGDATSGNGAGVAVKAESTGQTTAYPDTSRTNRSSPCIGKGVHEIATRYDSRLFDMCGDLVCTTGSYTRVWSLNDGELLMSLAMGDGIKGLSVAFKPGLNVDEEGKRVWIANSSGEVMEADIATQSIVSSKPQVHSRHEVIKIHRHFNELWTLDDPGTLHVWAPDDSGVPNLTGGPTQSFRLPRGHLFSLVVGDELWHATGKEIRVFLPTADGRPQFQVLMRPLCQESAGEVTSGTLLSSEPDRVFFGHNDGKVSIYSRSTYACLGVVNVSAYKINSLAGAGQYIWAGYNNGRISVFDMAETPWLLKKDWLAHDNPVVKMIADSSSFYRLDRYHVVSLGADNMLRAWDGLLRDDWLQDEMKRKDSEYCEFQKIKGLVMTWNAGASTPHSLRYSDADSTFIRDLLRNSDSPDILIFGFQELVDLEDKTATASALIYGGG